MNVKAGAAATGPAWLLAWLLAGLVVWGVGGFGIAVGLEDRCLQVAIDHDYAASSQSAAVWPPHFACELSGPEDASAADSIAVEQRGAALLRTGWLLGAPVAWALLGVVASPWRGRDSTPSQRSR